MVVDSDWDKKVWDANNVSKRKEERNESELFERLAEQGLIEELKERREKRKENENPTKGGNKWRTPIRNT
jgi:hypothetical protein